LSNWKRNFRKFDPVRGWLLDVYPSGPSQITVWIIAENGERLRFIDNFTRRVYVSGRMRDLQELTRHLTRSKSVAAWRFVEKSDFFTTRLMIGGKRMSAAFLLKGHGTKGKLTINKCGKKGDQILKLLDEPARVYIVQHVGEIDSDVIKLLEKLVAEKSRKGKNFTTV